MANLINSKQLSPYITTKPTSPSINLNIFLDFVISAANVS